MNKVYPFKFLDAYTNEDTAFFFGRKDEISILYEMIFTTNIILIYGASGTGKTSLIQCGLAGQFQSHDWNALSIRKGRNISESLFNVLNKAISDIEVFGENPDETIVDKLTCIYLNTFRPLYLVFDQFEELFILGTKDEEKAFIDHIKEILAIDLPVKMIFSIREEYLGHLADFEKAVPELFQKKLRVEPMGYKQVKKVIIGATGNKLSLVKITDLQQEAVCVEIFEKLKANEKTLTIQLPYLQVLLEKIYRKTKDIKGEALLNIENVRAVGSMGDVLREFLEDQVNKVKTPTLPEQRIWSILSRFATLEGTKEPVQVTKLTENLNIKEAEELMRTINSFVSRNILRYIEERETYELVHDSLAQKIAEKRSAEDIAILEISRIINSKFLVHANIRGRFSEKELNYIEPYLPLLRTSGKLKAEEELLINQSKERITQQAIEEIRKNEEALFLAKERAKEEEQSKKQLQQALNSANVYLRKVKRISRIITIITITASIFALFALMLYYEKKRADKKNEVEKIEAVRIEHLKSAEYLKSIGLEYKNLKKYEEAKYYYQTALDSIKNYPNEPLYQELEELSKQ